MSDSQIYIGALAMVLAAVGMWLMLPRGERPGRLLGAVIGIVSLVLFGALGARMGTIGSEVAFATLGAVTIIAAAATVTFRSPVYCALWFALSLLGTAGLFMMQGAQFLGVATIVVYAGAILVTFLFVLMLAQPGGQAYYDRVSWEGMFAATTGAVIVGFLTMTVVRVLSGDDSLFGETLADRAADRGVLSNEHVATLGAQLFSRHLIAIEVAGTLLLVALVGAIAIVNHERPLRQAFPRESSASQAGRS